MTTWFGGQMTRTDRARRERMPRETAPAKTPARIPARESSTLASSF